LKNLKAMYLMWACETLTTSRAYKELVKSFFEAFESFYFCKIDLSLYAKFTSRAFYTFSMFMKWLKSVALHF